MSLLQWSKSIYSYGLATCLFDLGDADSKKEAAKLMKEVPDLRQRIAGKSIPLEVYDAFPLCLESTAIDTLAQKFVARKARKFVKQGGRLVLPSLEFGYFFRVINHAPRHVITSKMIPLIEGVLANLTTYENKPGEYEEGQGYWDDLCLANFLLGVCLRYVAYPVSQFAFVPPTCVLTSCPDCQDSDAILEPNEIVSITQHDAETKAAQAFSTVLENGQKIELDHHLVYHTRESFVAPLVNREMMSCRFQILSLVACSRVSGTIRVLKSISTSFYQVLYLSPFLRSFIPWMLSM